MLKLRVLSDLHFEFHKDDGVGFVRSLDPRGVDVLVLAGDITKVRIGFYKTLSLFRKQFPGCPIVVIHGNHEFHETNRETAVRQMKHAVSNLQGVHWLDCDVVEIGGRRFVGTPMWFGRKKAPQHPMLLSTDEEWERGVVRTMSERGLDKPWTFADFDCIENFDTWVYDEHGRAIKFLCETVREGDIVITHHLPSQQSVHPKFRGALSNCWYVSDVEILIEERKPALWVHGHTHVSLDYQIGPTRVVCNPFGYVSQGEYNERFDENFTVELPPPV